MSAQYKYQEEFAAELAYQWEMGNHTMVRTKIRGLKTRAQSAFIAALVTHILSDDMATQFTRFMHPNNG